MLNWRAYVFVSAGTCVLGKLRKLITFWMGSRAVPVGEKVFCVSSAVVMVGLSFLTNKEQLWRSATSNIRLYALAGRVVSKLKIDGF
jgi:uncharacterized membrane protein YbaN (DUF454 family)